ncbi:hypothetical protein M407DRAFT_25575 [Tulasnella calospora MUT 4182]|uniref:NYN domain-containing protein n=1 Tax=Tulasnella calospora MUT 4182 TaxID=1051891 RepID=A0A0C3Q6L9_9AGAM|nr:hypothetical protein M407DRAFT_25575 [Tulasnella calospora MUT 4182]
MSSTIPDAPSSDVKKEPVVGVFWDYESCPPPPGHPGSAVVGRIQSVMLASGSIRVFNVYVDLEKYRTKPKVAAGLGRGLREEFHSLGVAVLDCPSLKSSKTVADKMIIVDLFTFASANRSELVTLVVISKDPDLAYTLSLLRQRHCKITVISPSLKSKDTGVAPGFQADNLLTWEAILKDQERLALGQTKNITPSGPATISPVPPMYCQNTSGPEAKIFVPSVLANARADLPAIRPGGNAGTVGTRTTPLDRPATNQQPATSSMPSQETCTSGSSSHTSFDPEYLHEVVVLLATARKQRGWPAFEVQRQLGIQRKLLMDERTVLGYLEEGIRLGIFKQETKPPSGGRSFPLTFYAVKQKQ